jgi:uncharacterized membrane protein
MNETDALVADYLKRLEKELSDLSRARRRELVQEISEHIDEARSGLEAQSEAEMRTLLDRLGTPLTSPPRRANASASNLRNPARSRLER